MVRWPVRVLIKLLFILETVCNALMDILMYLELMCFESSLGRVLEIRL